MKTSDFRKQLTSSQLKENMNKMFGVNVNISKYSREQLEDMRNKLRTRVFHQEGRASINDLLTNETYQKDKAMLDLLNTRIKEMLGENIKQLRDKMMELSEGKRKDQTGDGKNTVDDVQVARMTAGGVPKKKAIAKATSDNIKEVKMSDLPSRTVKGSSYGNQSDYKKPPEDARRPATTMPAKKDKKPLGEDDAHPKDCDCKECMGTMESKKSKPDTNNNNIPDYAEDGKGKNDLKKKGAAPKKGVNPFAKKDGKTGAAPKKGVNPFAKKDEKKKVKENVFKQNVRFVNESLDFLLQEDEEGKAKAITSAGDMVNNFTSWMQRVGQYQTKTMIELADAIKADFGAQEAEAFKASVGPALSSTLEMLTQQREAISNAVAVLAGEATAETSMGMEPGMAPDAGMDMSAPDEMNPAPAGDEFGAADAAAGMGTTGREIREGTFSQKLRESHNIMSALSK